MAVWTISAEEGTDAGAVAAALAEAAGVPLVDREILHAMVHESDPRYAMDDDLETLVGGRFNSVALSLALVTGIPSASYELELSRRLPTIGRTVVDEAARHPCVILAPAAFAAVTDRHGMTHVRLRAPLDWRIARYAREHIVDRRNAEKAIRHDDDVKRRLVRSLYGADIDDARRFTIVADASRISGDDLASTMLCAAGIVPEARRALVGDRAG
jgi:Cytidylate kinase-like family